MAGDVEFFLVYDPVFVVVDDFELVDGDGAEFVFVEEAGAVAGLEG